MTPAKSASPQTRTKTRLLEAAEKLLLESSYDSVSVRAICARAGANPAAVHYHYGSKDQLVVALLQDRLTPLWDDDLQRLAEEGVDDVETLVRVIVSPLKGLADDPLGQVWLHLLTRFLFSSTPDQWTRRWFAVDPFVEVLRRVLPRLSPEEAARRWVFAFRLIVLEFGNPLSRRSAPSEAGVRHMVRFVTAGLTTSPGE